VAAISYYLVGLIGYFLGGLPHDIFRLEKKTAMAITVPLVLASVWWTVRRIRHRLIKQPVAEEHGALKGVGAE
jgi:uncharacterized membrane-anchored protein